MISAPARFIPVSASKTARSSSSQPFWAGCLEFVYALARAGANEYAVDARIDHFQVSEELFQVEVQCSSRSILLTSTKSADLSLWLGPGLPSTYFTAILVCQELLDFGQEHGDLVLDGIPHQFGVHQVVAVNEDVSEGDDALVLADARGRVRVVSGEAPHGLAYDLEVSLHG